jgi:hypothetical protein
MKPLSNLLALDVATRYMGYALYAGTKLEQYGVIKAKSSADWVSRCVTLRDIVSLMCCISRIDRILLEYPTFQAGQKGLAASRSGGTLELAYLCGMIASLKDNSELVTFRQWNGQCPKEVTCKRFTRFTGVPILNPRSIDNNAVDAVMMGRWWLSLHGSLALAPCPLREDWPTSAGTSYASSDRTVDPVSFAPKDQSEES